MPESGVVRMIEVRERYAQEAAAHGAAIGGVQGVENYGEQWAFYGDHRPDACGTAVES